MKNWTIKKRIITGGTILIALLLVVGGISTSSLSRLKTFAGARLRDDAVPGIVYMSDMAEYVLRSQISALMAGKATDPAKRDKFISQMEEQSAKVSQAFTNYEATITSAEDRRNYEDLTRKRANYRSLRVNYLDLAKAGKGAQAEAFCTEQLETAFTAYQEQAVMMLKWNQDIAVKVTNDMVATAQQATLMVAVISVTSLFLGIAIGWVVIRGTNRVLAAVADSLDDGSDQVANAAAQVSASSQALAEGSSEQASSLEETSSSLEEMASMTKRNAEHARKANELGKQAREAADRGVGDMETMAAAMETIKASSDDIAKIIKTIDEIAFQTNILALNAAVEAARAGEAGMGFAVVADEVRNLAQRCAQAAKETAAKIEGAIAKTGQGVDISGKVAQVLGEIVTKVRQVDELVTEVANASREQTHGVTQINSSVGQMDKVTQSNAASAEESAAAAQELNAQAAVMKESVGELLQLVGGKGGSGGNPTQKSKTPTLQAVAPTAKRPIQTTKKKEHTNGHSHPAPALAGVAKQRSEIPLEGDFKDF